MNSPTRSIVNESEFHYCEIVEDIAETTLISDTSAFATLKLSETETSHAGSAADSSHNSCYLLSDMDDSTSQPEPTSPTIHHIYDASFSRNDILSSDDASFFGDSVPQQLQPPPSHSTPISSLLKRPYPFYETPLNIYNKC